MQTPTLLTDAQLQQFIAEGFLKLNAKLADEIETDIMEKLGPFPCLSTNPDNNIVPSVPSLRHVLHHPVVRGALQSVLGPEYVLQPHRYAHVTRPDPRNRDQPRHRDSYFGYQKMRSLPTWEAMIFYFPHDVTVDMGPTVVIPFTQYSCKVSGEEAEVKQSLRAGDFYLVHYNLWHKGTANRSDTFRIMVKFQFIRTRPPCGASLSWDHNPDDIAFRHMAPSVGMNDVWNAVWRWHLGVPSIPSPVAVDTAPLWAIFNARSGNEYNELNTAHLLALAESPRMLAAAVASERAWDDAWFLNKVSDFSSPRPCVGMYAAYALGLSPPGPLRDESLVSLLRTGDLLPTATAFALHPPRR